MYLNVDVNPTSNPEKHKSIISALNDLSFTADCSVDVLAYSGNSDGTRRIGNVRVNGEVVWQGSWCGHFPNCRGVNTLRIDPFSCSVEECRFFDTYASETAASQLSDYLQQLDDGTVIVGVSADEPSKNLSGALPTLRDFGVDVGDVQRRGSFAFIAQKGFPDKTVLSKILTEAESNSSPAQVNAIITGINVKQESLADAKVSARQQGMYEVAKYIEC